MQTKHAHHISVLSSKSTTRKLASAGGTINNNALRLQMDLSSLPFATNSKRMSRLGRDTDEAHKSYFCTFVEVYQKTCVCGWNNIQQCLTPETSRRYYKKSTRYMLCTGSLPSSSKKHDETKAARGRVKIIRRLWDSNQ